MKVQVNYTTQIKAAVGQGLEQIDVPRQTTLPQLLETLADRHGAAFRDLVLDDQGKPLPSILICIGDQQVNNDSDSPLRDGDEVTILSAISGG